MKVKFFIILRHSILMVGRTIKNYMMLSMTVSLSFSILLGYLLFTDSNLYNQNKIFLTSDERIVLISNVDSNNKMNVLLKQAENIGYETIYYIQSNTTTTIKSFWGNNHSLWQKINVIPSYVWGIYNSQNWIEGVRAQDILWLDGRTTNGEVYLAKNEILLERGIYEYMNLDEMDIPTYKVAISVMTEEGMTDVKYINATVVGLIETAEWTKQTDGTYTMNQAEIYMSQATAEEVGYVPNKKTIVFSSDEPAAIKNAAIALGFDSYVAMYECKEVALNKMIVHTETKSIIAMVLCILLAINLYGSFSNAMQSRKFEVGVKRAIGATKFSIIRQFLWEGIVVMIGNIYLSIIIIMNGILIYKYIYQFIENEIWTIYLSKASIAMFGVVTISLTVIFSLVFAIQATKVEIVQYLKVE